VEKNLFDLLQDKFYETSGEKGGCNDWPASQEPTVDYFVDFCKKYMADNPPVGTAVVARGLGVRLRKGQTVCLVVETEKEGMPNRPVLVTNPGVSRDDMAPTTVIHVTNPDR
jgi:hypothetical protein